MATLRLDPGERVYWHVPVVNSVIVPDIQVGTAAWAAMTVDTGYTPDPVVAGATWYRALFAHPDATGNPSGTFVVTGPTRVALRFVGNPETVVEHLGWAVPE